MLLIGISFKFKVIYKNKQMYWQIYIKYDINNTI